MGSVAQKIRKAIELRRLARRTTAGPERVAAERAARGIMREYGISERDLLLEEKQIAADTQEEVTVLAQKNEQQLWRRALVEAIVNVFGLVAHENQARKLIYVVGTPEARSMVASDVKKITETMTTAARPHVTRPPAHTLYMEGCVLGFAEQLQRRYDERARTKRIMVLRIPEKKPMPAPAPAPQAVQPVRPVPGPPQVVRTYVIPPPAAAAAQPRMVPIGQPPDPRIFEDGRRFGQSVGNTYFDMRYDDSLALRAPK